ncbi:DUF86 domain-containing protein [Brachybacterium sp. JHP9]|uniref:DUF86 domain-containing protein n=1 Tax=Brachybacterium equifaecis TaxID=2910770 RepID=A0ABT0R185_9MICO|nr:HepT-like ribonuclease domain-containing protein [Brachybacterium equifaecis]MCL6422710.1 DUF86 domain-containing protein [Brachybacterium equifaecis]
MRPTSRAHLWDARQACLAALSFVEGLDAEAFHESLLIQSAVERQLEILGEALNRIRRTDPEIADELPDLDRIIGMRNILAHEYGVVDHAIVWSVVDSRLLPLGERLADLLELD